MNIFTKSVILIPTRNERENLEKLIPKLFRLLPGISVLIVDDNSGDGTKSLIERLKNKFPSLFLISRYQNFGYGRACIAGFLWALEKSFEYLITMDADFSHDPTEIPAMLQKISENADVVIGSRYVASGGIDNWDIKRRLLSRWANFYVRKILRLPIRDMTSGFNGYRLKVLTKIDLNSILSEGYAFLVELKYIIARAGLRILEHPIIFHERRLGKSKMSGHVIWESILLPWHLLLRRNRPNGKIDTI